MARAAAFFDLDRTLLRRSSALALAGSFREHGVIARGQLAKAAAWQLLFVARGASDETVRKAAEDGLMILAGFRLDDLRALVATRWSRFSGRSSTPSRSYLVARHRERGEPVYIVSATLQEIVEELARDLGFDGALGRRARSRTASTPAARCAARTARRRPLRARVAEEQGLDLAASTAYSDSHTDLPFLEAVGHPVAVNPDRELRRIAVERGWPVLEFGELAYPSVRRLHPALIGLPFAVGAAGAADLGRAAVVRPEERIARARVLRGGRGDSPSTSTTPSRAGSSATGSPDRLARDAQDLDPAARPRQVALRARLRALGRRGALGYLRSRRSARAARGPAGARRVVVAGGRFPTGMLGYCVRRLAEGGLVALSPRPRRARLAAPGRRRAARRHEPARDRDPEPGRRADRHRRLDGAVTYGDVLRGAARPEELVPFGGEQAHKAFALAARARSCSSTRSPARATAPCSSSRGRSPTGAGSARTRSRPTPARRRG